MRTALPDVAEYPAIRFNAEDWKAILGPLVHAKAIVNRTRYRELRREVQMAVETLIVTRYFSKHDLAIRERRGRPKVGGGYKNDPLHLLQMLAEMDKLASRWRQVLDHPDGAEIFGRYDAFPHPPAYGAFWRLRSAFEYHRVGLRQVLDDTPSGSPQAAYAGFVRLLGKAFEKATVLKPMSEHGEELFLPFVRAIGARLPDKATRPGVNDNYFASNSDEAEVAQIKRALAARKEPTATS